MMKASTKTFDATIFELAGSAALDELVGSNGAEDLKGVSRTSHNASKLSERDRTYERQSAC